MSVPFAIWFHCRLTGGSVNTPNAVAIMQEQLATLNSSGAIEQCSEFIIGCSESDRALAASLVPNPMRTIFVTHPDDHRGELPTLAHLRAWLPGHPHEYVLYLHIKCATRFDQLCTNWRRCMMRQLVWNHRHCRNLLDLGHEAVGCHWLTPEECGAIVRSPFFGGNFWWARASFLATLPELPPSARTREEFYLAESWIGMGPRRPVVKDLHHQWPNEPGCGHMAQFDA